ncbi:MAG: phosphotransferase [Actinomycetota bacterium]
MQLPATPGEIDATWVNRNLPGHVIDWHQATRVETQDIGEGTGIFGEIARLAITLDDGSTTSVVAKMPCTEPANLEVALMLGIYEREINMFEHVIPRSSLNAPECHLALRGEDGHFVLIMEDMGRNWDVGDQVVGATLEQAKAIVDALIGFHAEWWGHPDLTTMEWLPRPDAPQYVAAVPQIYAAGLEPLQANWSDRVSAEAIELALALAPKFEDLLHRTATGPDTLIHTDTRLDNIFFARNGSDQVAFIDFQLALVGRGVADLAYLVGTSVPREIANEHWESLLLRWHDGISDRGIDYAWDDAVQHYREASLYYLSGAMSLIGTFDAGNDRGAAMAEAYATRILEHCVDIDAGQVL